MSVQGQLGVSRVSEAMVSMWFLDEDLLEGGNVEYSFCLAVRVTLPCEELHPTDHCDCVYGKWAKVSLNNGAVCPGHFSRENVPGLESLDRRWEMTARSSH